MLLYFSSEIFNKKGINNILLRGLEQWKNKNKLESITGRHLTLWDLLNWIRLRAIFLDWRAYF